VRADEKLTAARRGCAGFRFLLQPSLVCLYN
jgi:hypothetical protein